MIRVLQIGDSGRDHVDILRKFATGPNALFNDNHSIPVIEFLEYEDLVFGVFPKVGFRMSEAYGGWAKNSVGDVLDMILQCLEVGVPVPSHRSTRSLISSAGLGVPSRSPYRAQGTLWSSCTRQIWLEAE